MAIEQTVEYWLSYGEKYINEARWKEAENCYRQALEIKPDQATVLGRLGMLAFRERRLSEAEQLTRKSIKLDTKNYESQLGLGLILEEQGHYNDSIIKYKRAIALQPDSIDAMFYLGSALTKAQQYDDAITSFTNILTMAPDYIPALDALGHLYQAKNEFEKAINSFQTLVKLQPQNAAAYYQLAASYNRSGDTSKAIENYQRALEIDPKHAKSYVNIGNIYSRQKNYSEAIKCYSQALEINPLLLHACYNLAKAFLELKNYESASHYFLKTLELKPTTHPDTLEVLDQLGVSLKNHNELTKAEHYLLAALKIAPEAHSPRINLALTHLEQGRVEDALSLFKQALDKNPHDLASRSDYLLALNYSAQHTVNTVRQEHVLWNEALHHDAFNSYELNTSAFRRLRLGLVSPDFRRHSVWYFISHFLKHYDRDQFEVVAYSNLPEPQQDEVSHEIKETVDAWKDISSLSDLEATQQIHQDQVDILVDLAGHTGNNRLAVFAKKPAPIQLSYLGYPNTTGLSTMDYRIVDEHSDPKQSADQQATEQLIRLPHGFLCYQPAENAPEISPLPVLSNNFITFGSFNNAAKITSDTINLWTQILARTPQSRLILKHRAFSDDQVQAYYLKLFSKNGIDEERLELRGWNDSTQHHLETYHEIDIALDPILYNGTTTTCEALWMGVPVITLTGDRHAARVGHSIMTHAGFDFLIANSGDAYIKLATSLADDFKQLEAFRTTARQKLSQSDLFNAQRHTQDLEQAFREMWQQWCHQVK